ncbi:MAG: hypothetical protein Kow0010_27670 [Dehalococcoidia bacterium]
MRRMVMVLVLVLPLLFAALPLVGVAVWGDEAEPAAVMVPREPVPVPEPASFETSHPAGANANDPFVATVECERGGGMVAAGS